jgi:DNA-binding helix-hairpin-helix protein with protein kinase domain
MEPNFKAIFDYVVGPILIALNLVFQVLPAFALLVPVVYYSIQIYESKTFQQYRHDLNNRKTARIAAKILKLKAKIVERETAVRQSAAIAKVVSAAQATQAAQVSQLAQVPGPTGTT